MNSLTLWTTMGLKEATSPIAMAMPPGSHGGFGDINGILPAMPTWRIRCLLPETEGRLNGPPSIRFASLIRATPWPSQHDRSSTIVDLRIAPVVNPDRPGIGF